MVGPRGRGRGGSSFRGRGGGSRGRGGGGRGRGGRGRGAGRGRGGRGGYGQSTFAASRLEDDVSGSDSDEPMDEPSESEQEPSDDGSASDDDDGETTTARPYNELLQIFNTATEDKAPAKKRRKLAHTEDDEVETIPLAAGDDLDEEAAQDSDEEAAAIPEPEEEADIDDEEEDASDPFEKHFTSPEQNDLPQAVKAINEKRWTSKKSTIGQEYKQFTSTPESSGQDQGAVHPVRELSALKLKAKLASAAEEVIPALNALEQSLTGSIFSYQDLLFAGRTPANASRLRDLTSLHALNLVFKTRDRVIKNNARLSRDNGDSELDLRDQGFTRPKVLYILPTRQACVKVVDSIVKLCNPEQQENKKRFTDSFSSQDDETWADKTDDFRDLFGGNDDDAFRLGLKFTRKTVKFFSKFYNSDIILASPLGLRTALEKDGKKQDSDYLSSIELVVVDHADALLMQNWDHVDYIFQHLNLQPKEAHGCDFSRVRSWYLDGHARHLRQTIITSSFLNPDLNNLFTTHMQNIAGKTRISPIYDGSMLSLPQTLPAPIRQTFSRFDSPSPATDPDSRFKYFTSTILPALTRRGSSQGTGTLIFVPTYADFTRLRNHFATSTATENLSFGSISEYTSVRDVARARSHFLTGRHSVILYTERAHHFRRYRIRGVKNVVMYGVPENPIFWSEIVGYLGIDAEKGKDIHGARALFSKWDVLKVERIVGSQRVGGLVREKGGGDTFDFI